MTSTSKDFVEREIVITASIERAFAALTDPAQYPTWGPERIEGKLVPGERPVLDFGPAGGGKVAIYVVAFEPPRYFAYNWVQGVSDPVALLADPLAGPYTLVEFKLEPIEAGTRVRVIESGLAALPGMAGADLAAALKNMGIGWGLMLGGLGRSFEPRRESDGDRIENSLVLPVPRAQVYAALVQPGPWWGGVRVDGEIAAGERPVLDFGNFGKFRIEVCAAEPPHYLAYRRPQGVDDPAAQLEPSSEGRSTLVELHLDDAPEGTLLRQSESGFRTLTLTSDDRDAVMKRADQGWGITLGMLQHHLHPS
jgi:uncharacterized protein YndB with AHSA1/START domain